MAQVNILIVITSVVNVIIGLLCLYSQLNSLPIQHRQLPEITWTKLQHLIQSKTPPTTPCRIISSPQQQWLSSQKVNIWTPKYMLQVSQTNQKVGSTLVNLRSSVTDSYFTHHYEDNNNNNNNNKQHSTSKHITTPTPLHEALQKIWSSSNTTSSKSKISYYLAPDMQSLPPEILPYDDETLLSFIPDGCLSDDLRHSSTKNQSQQCRGLSSMMWIGQSGASAAMHYDLQHNLFLQASGSKKFSLLSPTYHSLLQLYPRSHGSQRQGQVHFPDVVMNNVELQQEIYVVELQPGDAIYVPPLWLHYVESIQGGVAANFWTDSLASDVWLHLMNQNDKESENGNAGNWIDLYDLNSDILLQTQGMIFVLLSKLKQPIDLVKRSMKPSIALRQYDDSNYYIDKGSYQCNKLSTERIQNLCNTKKPLNHPYAAHPDVMNVLNGYASDLNLMEENSQSLMLSEFIDEFVLFGIREAKLDSLCTEVFVDACVLNHREYGT